MDKFFILIMVAGFLLIGGCQPAIQPPQSPIPVEALQEKICWARDNLQTVEQIDRQKFSPVEYERAKAQLELAERSFTEQDYEQAYFAALDSLDASQQILREFYQQTIVSSAADAKARIVAITVEDPENPLQEFLPALNNILDYSERLDESDNEVDILRVLADLEQVAEIGQNTQKTIKQTLESDVSFASGEYTLSTEGMQILERYCGSILAARQDFERQFPDRKILVRIHVLGYTDELHFRAGTNLLKMLQAQLGNRLPQSQPELRKALNQQLAGVRAATINDFLVTCLRQSIPDEPIEQQNIGLGEELPPNLEPPYPVEDTRRRICKIYTYVLVR